MRKTYRAALLLAGLGGAWVLAGCGGPPPLAWSLEERWVDRAPRSVEVHNRSGVPITIYVLRGAIESRLGRVEPDEWERFVFRGPEERVVARTSGGEEIRLRPDRGPRGGRLRYVAERPRSPGRAGAAGADGQGWKTPAAPNLYQRAGVPRASTWMKGPRTALAR